MARAKHGSLKALTLHCLLYCIPLCFISIPWAIFNTIVHFFVDSCSSKITHFFFFAEKEDWHKFFCFVGLDQLSHYVTLFSSYLLIVGNVQ